MKLSKIKPNPNNPRIIRDSRFTQLKNSIQKYSKFFGLRPIVVDDNYTILSGNQRYHALKDLGYKDIPDNWIIHASELTEDEQKAFIIIDNVQYGDWDYDLLANEWNIDDLINFGLDLNYKEETPVNKEKEVDEHIDTKNECPKCGYKW